MRQRWLWFGILAVGVANFAAFSPMAVTIPLLVRDVLGEGPAAYGATSPRRARAASPRPWSPGGWLFSTCLSPLGLLFAGALAGPIGVRPTILLGAGLSAALPRRVRAGRP